MAGSLWPRLFCAVVQLEYQRYHAIMSSDPVEVVNLFRARVPEIASGVVTIRGAVRDPGERTILVVSSTDPAVDSVGACVGIGGAIVKGICAELHEYIDIVRWSDTPKTFITNL